MPFYSCTQVIGHVTADPEIRHMANGDAVANFTVAYNEKWKSADGTPKEKAEFFRCSCFGKTAEKFIAPYLKKGALVQVIGKMWTRKWQDQSGNDRYSTELVLDRFNGILILKDGSGGDSKSKEDKIAQARARRQQGSQDVQAPPKQEDFNDSIPF